MRGRHAIVIGAPAFQCMRREDRLDRVPKANRPVPRTAFGLRIVRQKTSKTLGN
jgi:hypothetical protein